MDNVKICPKCGHKNSRYFVACSKCGTSLDGVDLVDAETGEKVQEANSAANSTAPVAKNGVASVLKEIAIITYVGAFILGVAMGIDGVDLICWAAGFISGTVFLGFSEIIRLLHEINQKTKE